MTTTQRQFVPFLVIAREVNAFPGYAIQCKARHIAGLVIMGVFVPREHVYMWTLFQLTCPDIIRCKEVL